MRAVKFLESMGKRHQGASIFGSPIIEPVFPDLKKRERNVGSIRTFLEIGRIEDIVKFIEKAPSYLPYVVAALIDPNENVSFNAEWCIRRLAHSSDKTLKIVLKNSLLDFVCSPWINQGLALKDQRATELANEMRELHDFIGCQ